MGRSTTRAVDAYDNEDSRPAGHRRCQRRRENAATALRTSAAAAGVRKRGRAGALGNALGGALGGSLGGDDGNGAPDDVPARLGRMDAALEPGVAARTAADSGPASGRFCIACTNADSTCGSSIPATWSQADPGSRGGS